MLYVRNLPIIMYIYNLTINCLMNTYSLFPIDMNLISNLNRQVRCPRTIRI